MNEYIIQESSLMQLVDLIRSKFVEVDADIDFVSDREQFNVSSLPESITNIGNSAFAGCINLTLTSLPKGIANIGVNAFYGCINLKSLTFKGRPVNIHLSAFDGCYNLKTINVPWSEGAVAGVPWGATNATINYNYVEEEK